MAVIQYLVFCSLMVFIFSAGAKEEEKCHDASSNIKCGEPADKYCYEDSCYTFNTDKKTWIESRQACERDGGYLVSIEKHKELKFLQEEISKPPYCPIREWYIGLYVEKPIWSWVSGKGLTIDHWQSSQPSGDGDVTIIAKHHPPGYYGTFNDMIRKTARGSICETARRGSAGKNCFNTSCYTFNEVQRDWKTNRKECQKNGGDLVSMETEQEWKYINRVIQKRPSSPNILPEWHIGLTRKDARYWKWVSNTSLSFTNSIWLKYRPRGRTPFVFMGKAVSLDEPIGIFDDPYSEDDKKPYICEKRLVYTPPSK